MPCLCRGFSPKGANRQAEKGGISAEGIEKKQKETFATKTRRVELKRQRHKEGKRQKAESTNMKTKHELHKTESRKSTGIKRIFKPKFK